MNIVKKIITIILASAIIISCAAVTFADNISANDKIEQLIENGEKAVNACKIAAKETGYTKSQLYSIVCGKKNDEWR